ncbi:MAG: hypothetical protein AVDCRST_MAG93-6752 [uncultured Chloroflexia bacterium]|uniref:Uncharacterized protein n=1 Tax=uncultured Chloroflexia bacterium TaxID=1672391 RepID=A0A6J4M0S8_9CHLR|nr:MAG: hypothetical protein AVDCRST_MAG93-6752 [uncultured Chloroflexia bacterium]
MALAGSNKRLAMPGTEFWLGADKYPMLALLTQKMQEQCLRVQTTPRALPLSHNTRQT